MNCSTSTMARPVAALSWAMAFSISMMTEGCRPSVGSSRSRSRGRVTLAGTKPRDVAAVQQHPPTAGTDHAHDGLDQGRLADAVAAHDADEGVAGDLHRHAEQHGRPAVARLEALDPEHLSAPRPA